MVMGVRILTRLRDCMYVLAKQVRRLETTAEIGVGTMIGNDGDDKIIPCARSRSEI
jgi:hypothetical protein